MIVTIQNVTIQVLVHTPVYVWFILAWLIWQGVQSLEARSRPVWRLVLVTVLFAVAGLWPLLLSVDEPGPAITAWLCAALPMTLLGALSGPRLLSRDKAGGKVQIAGSSIPVIRNLIVFGLHYTLAVVMAMKPQLVDLIILSGFAISGASIGYFSGWLLTLRRQLRKHAPAVA